MFKLKLMNIFKLLLFIPWISIGQITANYEPSAMHPFGKLNPDAPKELADFSPLIGTCDCISTARKADQTWAAPQRMTWTFKYIMNGMAIQDETIKEDGIHSGSIRQFIADSSRWYVHWYSNTTPSTTLPTWEGSKTGDSIVLYREQKAPNGMDGSYRLTFSDISESGFNWAGEWVDTSETFVFPTWKIVCEKRNPASDKEIILKKIEGFSKAYMATDYDALAGFYCEDGKIFPNKSDIIAGRTAIKQRWILPEGVRILHHKVTPSEIKIIGNHAYDYGYYEGKTLTKKKTEQPFKGKYVIVWKKIDGDWKIYLDIWNSL
jgi:ketosteroid isomerase-like protein